MTEQMRLKTAIVIGAGVGGVATAARLAKAGFNRFDQGPSLLLLPHLFVEAFHDLGTSLEAEGVKLIKCEPNYNFWFGDGESFEPSTDIARMKTEVEKWEGKDGFERYLGFLQESHRHYELSVKHVLRKNFTSLLSTMKSSFLRHLLALHPFESIYSRASKYFWTERLRRIFTFGSMYMGMSPFDAPETYSSLQYTELAEGIWYPEGGFHRIIEALVNVGERLGVTYRLSTPVAQILLTRDSSRAIGVLLSSGEQLSADIVVDNSDLVYAYNNPLPPPTTATALSKRLASCSSISFHWALDIQVPTLTAHNIFLADEYRKSFDNILKKQLIPEQPSFYVNVLSRVDPTAAPQGSDAHAGSNAPTTSTSASNAYHNANPTSKSLPPTTQEWLTMLALARRTVLTTIRARTGVDLSPHILHENVNMPLSWRSLLNLDKGAILGLSHSFFNVLCFRPTTRGRLGGRLGTGTYPGTGVPICLAWSKVTSEQILGDLGMAVPWNAGGNKDAGVMGTVGGKGIDEKRTRPLLNWFH
ncbi:hypothetical protein LTR39_001488 [Cryomyces antarcticus]|nr:hypothetical protein LTR39_001488 [Cryomyces antarcticus]